MVLLDRVMVTQVQTEEYGVFHEDGSREVKHFAYSRREQRVLDVSCIAGTAAPSTEQAGVFLLEILNDEVQRFHNKPAHKEEEDHKEKDDKKDDKTKETETPKIQTETKETKETKSRNQSPSQSRNQSLREQREARGELQAV